MPVRPSRLTEQDFEAAVTRTPWTLVRLDRAVRPFHRGVGEVLEERWPGLFTFATIARRDLRDPAFLDRALQSAAGAIRAGIQDGYWLLFTGVVVGHHSGVPRPANVSYGGESGADELRERIARLAGPSRDERETEAARQILEVLEPIVERKQRSAGFAPDGSPTAPRATQHAEPDDPYALLGIPETATDGEIRAAFKAQMKLNHPDKVAHLSPALQKFAEEQVLRIKEAYERLKGRG